MSYEKLAKVLMDRKLARFGDSYVNFIFSLALTRAKQEPQGARVSDRVLADAAVKTGLRKFLPRRIKRNDVANSVESLLVYGWLKGFISLEESAKVLEKNIQTPSDAVAKLAEEILCRIKGKASLEVEDSKERNPYSRS